MTTAKKASADKPADDQTTAPIVLTAPDVPAEPVRLPIPDDLPTGWVFNTVTGQRWCGQCVTGALDPSATSFTCEHGSWQATTQTFTPDEA